MFRERLVLSILSGKEGIFEGALLSYEKKLLAFIEQLTKGTLVIKDGAKTVITPGTLTGGTFSFECGTERGIGYFLEWLFFLGLFGKTPSEWTFQGITNNTSDVSIDALRTVHLGLLRLFSPTAVLEIKIKKRGFQPDGGGEVLVRIVPVQKLIAFSSVEEGKIKRIRGLSVTGKVPPQINKKIIESVREQLSLFTKDIHLNTDVFRGTDAGFSPGYAVCLVSESTTAGFCYAADVGFPQEPLEEFSLRVCRKLLKEIHSSGFIGGNLQNFLCLLMAVSSDGVSQIRFGKLRKETRHFLKEVRCFFSVVFERKQSDENILVCSGARLQNYSLKQT